MISYEVKEDGGVHVILTPKSKTLYLDIWFWSRLAKSEELRCRFIASAVNECTIMYSISTMVELATIRHSDQINAIREIMNAVDFGFIENNPITVINLEDAHETEIGSGVFSQRHPASDRDILAHLIKSKYPSTNLNMSDIYDELLEEIPDRFRKMSAKFSTGMNNMVRKARRSANYMEKVKNRRRKRHSERSSPPYTRDILQQFLDYVIVTKSLRMTRNDWMDMMHLIVPLSYLSMVLTDRRWFHFAQSELRLSNSDTARLYGPNNIEQFLNDL